jgi:hypothetical protein
MYLHSKHKKVNETKVRLSDPVEEIALRESCRTGEQKAVWMRRVVEEYLVAQGFDIPGHQHSDRKRQG